jgi:hypothetical protein
MKETTAFSCLTIFGAIIFFTPGKKLLRHRSPLVAIEAHFAAFYLLFA